MHYTLELFIFRYAHLSAQVHDIGVRVVKRQKNAVAGVHLLDIYGLVHVILRTRGLGTVTIRNIRIVSQKRTLKLCKIGKLNPLTWKSRVHYHTMMCGGAPTFHVYQPGVAYHTDTGRSPPKSGPLGKNTLLQLDGLRK